MSLEVMDRAVIDFGTRPDSPTDVDSLITTFGVTPSLLESAKTLGWRQTALTDRRVSDPHALAATHTIRRGEREGIDYVLGVPLRKDDKPYEFDSIPYSARGVYRRVAGFFPTVEAEEAKIREVTAKWRETVLGAERRPLAKRPRRSR